MSSPHHTRRHRHGLVWLPLLMFLIGFVGIWTLYLGFAQSRWEFTRFTARANNIPLTFADLQPANPPAAEKNRNDPAGQFAVQGYPPTDDERAILKAWVDENAKQLRRLDEALALTESAGLIPAERDDMGLPNHTELTPLRAAANLQSTAATFAFYAGDHAETIARLRRTLQIGQDLGDGGSIVQCLVAVGCNQLAIDRLGRFSATLKIGNGPGEVNREEVVRLIAELRDMTGPDRAQRLAFRGERVAQQSTIASLIDLRAPRVSYFVLPKWAQGRAGRLLLRPLLVHNRVTLMRYMDQVDQLADVTTVQQRSDRAKSQTIYSNWERSQPGWHERIAAAVAMPSGKFLELNIDARQYRELVAAALAVRLYRLDHNDQFPPTLDALVPAYLPAVPIDRWDGKPIRYSPDKKRLWSVGRDRDDDGGKSDTDPGVKRKAKYESVERVDPELVDDVIELAPTERPAQ
jgi:hypothetical protein